MKGPCRLKDNFQRLLCYVAFGAVCVKTSVSESQGQRHRHRGKEGKKGKKKANRARVSGDAAEVTLVNGRP